MIDSKFLIGRRKYEALKRYDFEAMTTDEMLFFKKQFNISLAEAEKKIADYEKHRNKSNTKANQEYFIKLNSTLKIETKKITKESLWKLFLYYFKNLEKKEFITSNEVIENLKPLFYYFTDDFKNFKKCKRLSGITAPSFEKGLLIVGDFGNGKSTAMNLLEKCLKNTDKSFKGYTTNYAVNHYEASKSSEDAQFFLKDLCRGRRYFDDLKTERMVSFYGRKFQLFKDVFETRDSANLITHATINYKKNHEGNLEQAIQEIGEIYGDRVNDRIYKMFNIVEFKGSSFRK